MISDVKMSIELRQIMTGSECNRCNSVVKLPRSDIKYQIHLLFYFFILFFFTINLFGRFLYHIARVTGEIYEINPHLKIFLFFL